MTGGYAHADAGATDIVFESFFGNTRRVAEAIAAGARRHLVAALVDVRNEVPSNEHGVLVVGAPTHAHSLSRPASRREAEIWAKDLGKHLTLEQGSRATGIREWIETDPRAVSGFAAFDTRVDMPRIFTGSAATAISTRLRKRGLRELVRPESFLVDKDSRLLAGEFERAQAWGAALALEALSGSSATGSRSRP
ncbi:hypothetical protein [uncultured Microbacterium sp.]|uniref:flavodoxin family protein n=1 Tax=uncultured Microbacterium sp. TaxID=191216 RepID=UPI0028E5ABF2|nr:hypothetical protein [uncultured Microbacterium sp.]